jgi:uncharacterized protein YhbP (UPF0306 family)
MNSPKNNLKKHILDYLEKNKRMTLATCEDNTPWAATVMFAYDTRLNFYFISNPKTRKTKNLLSNPKVSAAINEFIPKIGLIVGVQLEGTAKMLDKEKNADELEIFTKRFNWAADYLHDHELFKVTPKRVYYLDDGKCGPGVRKELDL